jgi:hypothetical protein
MKPELPVPKCPSCTEPPALVPRTSRYRRGDQILSIDGWIWQCTAQCLDPHSGATSFLFTSPPLMKWSDAQARAAWQERFHEPMPPSRRGRRKGPSRSVRVPVMFTPDEIEELDRIRGERSRSEFLRSVLEQRERKTG